MVILLYLTESNKSLNLQSMNLRLGRNGSYGRSSVPHVSINPRFLLKISKFLVLQNFNGLHESGSEKLRKLN